MTYTSDSALPAVTDQMLQEALRHIRPYTVCILKVGPSYQEPGPARDSWVADLIWEHGKRNYALYLAGLKRIVCPIGDGPRGVDIRLGAAIAEITPGKVVLADGATLPSDITVWAAGVAAPDAAAGWGLPQAAGGRIRTGPDLRVIGQDRIFAIGDIAHTGDQPLQQLAQPALQMGTHAADQIRRLAQGQSAVPFGYRDKGIMATIGYRSAVVQLPRHLRVRGTPAWLAWLALHLTTLLDGLRALPGAFTHMPR